MAQGTASPDTTATTRAGRREWAGLAVLALPTLLLALDASALYLALPHLATALGADSSQQLWIMDIYSFLIAGFLVTMGSLGDRIGRRRLLLIGATAFGAASILAAYATSPDMLIVARALLGVSGATLMPSTLALISNMFSDPRQRGVAVSVWMACFMGGMAVGPVISGALLAHFWWGSVFLIGVPVMALLLMVGPVLLPEFPKRGERNRSGRLDLTSVALSLGAILPVIYGLKEVARHGVTTTPVVAVAIGLILGWAFVRRQRTLPDPLLDLSLFTHRELRTGLGVMLSTGIVMAGISMLATMYLQMVAGVPAWRAGLLLVPQNIATVLGSLGAPALARRFPAARVVTICLGLAGVGILTLSQVRGAAGTVTLVAGLTVAAGAVAVMMSFVTNAILSAAPQEKAGAASALSETSGEFGIAVGVASLGSLTTAVYRGSVTDDLPTGVPTHMADVARESIANAVTVAEQLPDPLAAALIEGARTAFTTGFHAAAVAGGLLLVAMTVFTAKGLKPRTGTATMPVDATSGDTATEPRARTGKQVDVTAA